MAQYIEMSSTQRKTNIDTDPYVLGGGAAAAAAGGGALGHSGISDIKNKKVLLTYGTAKNLGQGHKTPAGEFAKIIEQLKKEEIASGRGGVLSGLEVLDAPTLDSSGTVADEVAEKIRKNKFIATIDTGWGLIDPISGHSESVSGLVDKTTRASTLYKYLPFLGKSHKQVDDLHLRTGKRVAFFPDGAGLRTGLEGSGYATHISRDPSFAGITYGTFDPGVTNHVSSGNLKYTGLTHPLVNAMGGGKDALSQDEYEKLVAKYLDDSGYKVGLDDIKGKKIITVSGASRGDSVGARSRWLHDVIQKSPNHNIDDFLILGIGSNGAEREAQIALSDGLAKNLFIGKRPGGPTGGSVDFVNLANNGYMHLMGQGGATPPEMLSHGGSPLATFSDEQVFSTKENKPWSLNAELKKEEGILGFENKLREAAKQRLGVDIPESGARGWMNPLMYKDHAGNEVFLNRGLDGIREYGDMRGIKEVNSSKPDSFLSLLDDGDFLSKNRTGEMARIAQDDILSGRAKTKEIIKGLLTNARKGSILKGTGKLGLGAALLGGAGMAAHSLIKGKEEVEPASMLDGVKEWVRNLVNGDKTASISQPPPPPKKKIDKGQLAGAIGLGGVTAGLIDTHGQLSSVDRDSKAYVEAFKKYINKYPDTELNLNPGRMEDLLSTLDEYAVAGKKMSNKRMMGIPMNKIFRNLPISSFLKHPLDTALSSIGILPKDPVLAREILELKSHYDGAGKDLRKVLTQEILKGSPLPESKIDHTFSSYMSEAEAEKIINAGEDIPLQERFKGVIERIREDSRANPSDMEQWKRIVPFQSKENRFIRGLDQWDNLANQSGDKIEKAMKDGAAAYANKSTSVFNKVKWPLRGLIGLAAAGSGLLGYNALNAVE